MPVPRIRLAVLGRLPADFDPADLLRWKSSIFEVDPSIESFQLNDDAQGANWEYTDQQLEKYFPNQIDASFLLILVNVKLENNWYLRRLSNNRVLFSFYEIDQILRFHSIPLKNVALRVLYAASLTYRRYGNRVPPATEKTNYTHDETRGCLFDMNASKPDVVHSCHEPIICEYCVAQLKNAQISNEVVNSAQSEIRNIRKPLFHRMGDFIKSHPLWSILISLITALVVGIIASILAAYLYDALKAAT